jgi:hypothetical protein
MVDGFGDAVSVVELCAKEGTCTYLRTSIHRWTLESAFIFVLPFFAY